MKNYNKRWIEILYFFFEKNSWVKGNDIALSVGVSSRTIRNDIKEINEILIEHKAEIISEIGVGYFLKIDDQNAFQCFLEEIKAVEKFRNIKNIIPSEANDRVWYITSQLLIHSLDQSERIDSFTLEEQLFISESTLKKDLRLIEKILIPYDLKISETKKQGLCIIGEESKIRFCISQYVFNNKSRTLGEAQSFYESVFDSNSIQQVKESLMESVIKYDLRLTDIAFNNLVVHTLIMLKRNQHSQHVNYCLEDIERFRASNEYQCAQEIIQQISSKLHISLKEEQFYLTQHLIASQRFLIEDVNSDYVNKEGVKKILDEINKSMHIDLSDDLQLINGLAIHLSSALQRLQFNMNIRNEFIDVLKNNYPLAFELAVMARKIIEQEYSLVAGEAEIGYLTIHFGASLERKGLNGEHRNNHMQNRSKKKVALVCIAGVAMALLLKEKLINRFGQYIDIVQTSPAQLVDEELLENMDVILTTVDLPEFHSEKIQKIDLFPNEQDYLALSEVLADVDKKSEIDYDEVFVRELFFVNQHFDTKAEVLDFMTDSMMKKGYIDAAIKKSVYEREEISTTEVGGLLAVPHAMLNEIETFAVSIMILDRPIVWEKQKVQVILLLNIPKKKYEVWERIFKNLYAKLITNGGVNRLIKHRDYDQFIYDMRSDEINLDSR